MQEAVKRFVATRLSDAEKATDENKSDKIPHGLALIDMPTGSGKTYNTLRLIEQYIRGTILQNVPRIFYLTPLNKNVKDAFEDTRKKFFTGQEKLFDESCLWLQANYQCVLQTFDSVRDEMPASLTKKESFWDLSDFIKTYKNLDNSGDSDAKAAIETMIRTKYEPAFRNDLKQEIMKLGANQREKLLKINSEWPWLRKLYPSIDTDKRKVLFMSVDKFCSINDTLVGKSYRFINSDLTKGALVFIDEIDASKEFVLRSQIDESVRNKMDLIRLFSTLTGVLASHKKFPKALFPKSEDGDEKKSSAYDFQEMQKVLLKTRDDYHLDYSFKLQRKGEQDRSFLFEDHSIHTISSTAKERFVSVKTDPESNQNIILSSQESGDGNRNFYRMIYGLNGALTFTIRGFTYMSRNYLNHYNNEKRGPNDDKMVLDDAASTMLDPFELDDGIKMAMQKMVSDGFSSPYPKQKQHLLASDFYLDGFRYFDFNDDISHDTTTKIEMCYLNGTPEKFLLNLALKAMVVGISATATIKTVTGNYDLDFLSHKLGNAYYEIPEEDQTRILANLRGGNAGDYKIAIHTMKTSQTKDEDLAKMVFATPDNVEVLEDLLQRPFLQEKSGSFKKKRYIRTLLAVKEFLANPDGKAMLVLTNNNLKKDKEDHHPFSKKTMEGLVARMAKESGDPISCYIHALYGNTFEAEKKKYQSEMRKGAKVILFSSYPAAGTGQNLQYTIVQGEDEKGDMERDIDSLYLEKPTNIIVNIKPSDDDNHPLSETDLIKYLYQIECLEYNGEVATSEGMDRIRNAFKVFMHSKAGVYIKKKGSEYATNSVNNHIVRTLEQAVGRICRTHGSKKADVNIYVDEEIYRQINFSCVHGKPMNREFKELIDKSQAEKKSIDEASRLFNVACNRSAVLNGQLNALMKDTKVNWSEPEIQEWGALRNWVLINPTCSKAKAVRADRQILYIEFPDGNLCNTAYFSFNKGEWSISAAKSKDYPAEISCAASRLDHLMLIPPVKQYFEENGFATSFREDECLLNPVAFTNLYKGALGEAAGLAILKKWGLELVPITDPAKFEKFDFCLKEDPDIYFDFKNWNQEDEESSAEGLRHIRDKLKRINGKKAFIVNAIADKSLQNHDLGDVCIIPSITETSKSGNIYIDTDRMNKLVAYITEAKRNDHHK